MSLIGVAPTIQSTRNHGKSHLGFEMAMTSHHGSWASNSEFTLFPGSPRIVEKVSVPRALEADGCLRLFLKAGAPGFCRECAKGVPEVFLSYL